MNRYFPVAVAMFVSMIVGCGAAPSDATPSEGVSSVEAAQTRLDSFHANIRFTPEGDAVLPSGGFELAEADLTLEQAVARVSSAADTPTGPICAGGYGSPMVCCSATGCCTYINRRAKCWGTVNP